MIGVFKKPGAWLGLALFVLLLIAWGYLHDRQDLVINYKNVSLVNIQKANAEEDPGKSTAPLLLYVASGKKVKLKKGLYIVIYKGSSGYAGGSTAVTLGDSKQIISINPDFSGDRLNDLLNTESGKINGVITSKYPNIKYYEVSRGKLFLFGEWYGTKLIYKGSDIFNSDSLRVVLHKVDGVWIVATEKPNINLSIVDFPNIPKVVLQGTNTL